MPSPKERLDRGETVILDGAIGTELQRMGVPMHSKAWCAEALKNHPQVVRQLHEDYIKAGADVITCNTFSSARYVLEPAGFAELTVELNTRAVTLATEARESMAADRPIYIAGVLSRFGLPRTLSDRQIRDAFQEQADIQTEAGVDLMLLEFLGGPLNAIVHAADAAAATELPVWVAMSARPSEDGARTLLGGRDHPSSPRPKLDPDVDFGNAIDAVMAKGGEALLIIHSEVRDTGPALKEARKKWRGPLGAYSHSGDWISPNWQFVNMISPAEYLAEAKRWVQETGAQIIGGCCGIGMQHIEKLRPGLPAKVPGRR